MQAYAECYNAKLHLNQIIFYVTSRSISDAVIDRYSAFLEPPSLVQVLVPATNPSKTILSVNSLHWQPSTDNCEGRRLPCVVSPEARKELKHPFPLELSAVFQD